MRFVGRVTDTREREALRVCLSIMPVQSDDFTQKRALEIPPYTSLLLSALFLHLSFSLMFTTKARSHLRRHACAHATCQQIKTGKSYEATNKSEECTHSDFYPT